MYFSSNDNSPDKHSTLRPVFSVWRLNRRQKLTLKYIQQDKLIQMLINNQQMRYGDKLYGNRQHFSEFIESFEMNDHWHWGINLNPYKSLKSNDKKEKIEELRKIKVTNDTVLVIN